MTELQEIYLSPGERLTIVGVEPEPIPMDPWTDMRDDMPENNKPDDPYFIASRITDWWHRDADQIDSITIHHTLAHDPFGIASYITKPVASGGKGRPTTEYTFWITQQGEALYCVDILRGCWHDHTGHRNTHISVGMAGRWDYEAPPLVQMRATADLCKYLMSLYPGIKSVKGHCDYIGTACPGWNGAGWRAQFYNLLSGAASYVLPHNTPDYSKVMEAE